MAARSLGRWRSLPPGAVIALTSSEAAALADLDGHSRVRAECALAGRREVAVPGRLAPQVHDFEHLDLLIRTLGAFVRVEVG